MKKLVKLTALLLALAMCVFTAGALAESTLLGGTVYEGTQTNVDNNEYSAAITSDEALIVSADVITFDLAKGNIVINSSTFTGYNANGQLISGQHSAEQKYVVTSSAETANTITLNDSNLTCDLTLSNVNRTASNSGLVIGGETAQYSNQNITLRIDGTNTIGQLFYVGNNQLKITSASGDGSTDGKLIANSVGYAKPDGSKDSWCAAIGGNDSYADFSGLTIAGGTIEATAANASAIGGGGNGAVEITITGGAVTATNSGTSATIGGGGGQSGYGGKGTVTIEGGTVTATNNGAGAAIGGGGSVGDVKVGEAVVSLIGGDITATANSSYGISGGYSANSKEYAATTLTYGAGANYTGTINPNVVYLGNEYIFDLTKASVIFNGDSFSGVGINGNAINGTHAAGNKYIVRQSDSSATSNQIKLEGKISDQVDIEIDGISSSAVHSIYIPASKNIEKNVVLYLKGENKVNNILYYTDAAAVSGYHTSSSTLKITSASGDGSTDGKLTVIPSTPSGSNGEDGSVYYGAAIGGTDSLCGVVGLEIAGGSLHVDVSAANDCSAIGGGGNGYAQIKISGGDIWARNASTGATIGGGVGYTADGSGCDIRITDGTVYAENLGKLKSASSNLGRAVWCYGVAIGGGSSYEQESDSDPAKVTITGGNVTAIVPKGQTAIGAGNSNLSNAGNAEVNVTGGTIYCEGGVGGGSTHDGNGGYGKLSVESGNVTVKGFIGGGATTAGDKGGEAEVRIGNNSGGTPPVVKAASIGGGVAEQKEVVSKAQVYITNGKVQAQVVMEGDGSIFDMSGGTIDNSNAAADGFEFKMLNGGAAYVGNGEATMTGGIITSCSTEGSGGAIYVTGGNFTLSGDGKITDCSASQGGAAYVAKGDFNMNGGEITECSAKYGGAAYVTGGNFTMTSGTLDDNFADNDGGGVYVTDGKVVIGVENCSDHSHPVLSNNNAKNGGAVAVNGSAPIMYCGEMSNNTATANGGAVYVTGGSFNMEGGVITDNEAVNGAGAYVTGNEISFNMSNDAAITANTATGDGGAAYVSGGNFNMNNGTLASNSSTNGGAVYVNDGDFTMVSGTIGGTETTGNTAAVDGGAVYVNGGNFKMISGSMTYNKANGDVTQLLGNGGAVLTENGNIYIGVEHCDGSGEWHIIEQYKDLAHPTVQNNVAAGCGGGLALTGNEGEIHIYCAKIIENQSRNDGLGHNVYMEAGKLYFYDGADIGKTQDPDMVIISGTFEDMRRDSADYIKLQYHSHNFSTGKVEYAEACAEASTVDNEVWINLPDGTRYFKSPLTNHRFFGWTLNGPDSDKKNVRKKDDYQWLGIPFEIEDVHDGTADNTIHLYALWAPQESKISYVGSVNDDEFTEESISVPTNPAVYQFNDAYASETLVAPVKEGYTFEGWYLYQDENQNANWGFEPYYVADTTEGAKSYYTLDYSHSDFEFLEAGEDGTVVLETGDTRFGNITLIAKWTSALSALTITKDGYSDYASIDPNQTFLFKVYGDPNKDGLDNIEMTIAIHGDDTVTIKELPVGTYTVTELTNWSWRYQPKDAEQSIELVKPEVKYELTFNNDRVKTKWLDGDCYDENTFNDFGPAPSDNPPTNQ